MPSGVGSGVARDVSNDGQVVVGETVDNRGVIHALRWSAGSPVAQYLGFLGTSAQYSEAHGVSGNGAVVVAYGNSSSGREAFRRARLPEAPAVPGLGAGALWSVALMIGGFAAWVLQRDRES